MKQFVRGQSDPELKKYLWVVIRTQKEKKLQTLIEVCTDFASLSSSPVCTVRRNRCSRWRKTTTKKRRCSPWWTDSSGTRKGRRNHLCHRSCSRCSLSRVAWATKCDQSHAGSTPLDRHRALAKLRMGIIALHLNHATTPGLSVLAAVNWDTLRFAVQNRTHLFRSDQADGSTGRTDLDGIVEHHHRETKYRPGPNPHWPVCHQIGPRFIHTCHFISSSGHFIYFHIRWDFILCFARRTIVSATDQGG